MGSSMNPSQRDLRDGVAISTVAMSLDPAIGSAMVMFLFCFLSARVRNNGTIPTWRFYARYSEDMCFVRQGFSCGIC